MRASKDDYLELAKHLKPILEKIDGFVDNERFESRLRPGWVLSHSTWRDEKSVVRWRTEGEHHVVQGKGRFEIFQDYHLRVGDVTADTDPPRQAPVRDARFDETEVGKAKVVTFTEITPAQGRGLRQPGRSVAGASRPRPDERRGRRTRRLGQHLQSRQDGAAGGWKDAEGRDAWTPNKIDGIETLRHRKVRVVRDYGRFDRREAPQFYDDVKGRETKHPRSRRVSVRTRERCGAKTAAIPETPACRHGHARGRVRRSGAGSETPCRD